MAEDRPDLRSLAEVDSPEVVSAALAAFRRKIWTRYAWVLAVIAAIVVVALQVLQPDSLREEIERSDGTLTNGVYAAGDSRLGVDLVADLGDTVGMHIVGLPVPRVVHGSGPRGLAIQVEGEIASERWGAFDRWYEIERPGDGIVRVRVSGPGCPDPDGCRIAIDLRALGVPPSIWR